MRWIVPLFTIVEASTPEDADAKAYQHIEAMNRAAAPSPIRIELDEIVPTLVTDHHAELGPFDGPPRSILEFWHPSYLDDGK